jgi:hypothetical protein
VVKNFLIVVLALLLTVSAAFNFGYYQDRNRLAHDLVGDSPTDQRLLLQSTLGEPWNVIAMKEVTFVLDGKPRRVVVGEVIDELYDSLEAATYVYDGEKRVAKVVDVLPGK